MPAVSRSRLQSLQGKYEQQQQQPFPPPSWEWPEFEHPALVTVAALALILVLFSILVCILWQLACLHLAAHHRHRHHHHFRRCSYGFVDEQQTYVDVKHPSSSSPHHRQHGKHRCRECKSKRPHRTQTAAALDVVQRTSLCGAESECARGSLYNTFQAPSPHAARLKFSRSMMELNGGDPLEGGGEDGGGQNKAFLFWVKKNWAKSSHLVEGGCLIIIVYLSSSRPSLYTNTKHEPPIHLPTS